MVFDDRGGLAWRAAQRLLFLDVIGEVGEGLGVFMLASYEERRGLIELVGSVVDAYDGAQ